MNIKQSFEWAKSIFQSSSDHQWIDFRGAPPGSKGIRHLFETPAVIGLSAYMVASLAQDILNMGSNPDPNKFIVDAAITAATVPLGYICYWNLFNRNLPVPKEAGIDTRGCIKENANMSQKMSLHYYKSALRGICTALPSLYAGAFLTMAYEQLPNIGHSVHQRIVAINVMPLPVVALESLLFSFGASVGSNAVWCGYAGRMLEKGKWTVGSPPEKVGETATNIAPAFPIPATNRATLSQAEL